MPRGGGPAKRRNFGGNNPWSSKKPILIGQPGSIAQPDINKLSTQELMEQVDTDAIPQDN